MATRAELSQYIQEMTETLNEMNTAAGDHLIKEHGGKPVSTCHDCLAAPVGIRSAKLEIQRSKVELAKQPK